MIMQLFKVILLFDFQGLFTQKNKGKGQRPDLSYER